MGGTGAFTESDAGGLTVIGGYAGQLNEPPLGETDFGERISGRSFKIKISELLSNDTDPEGDAISLLEVSSSSNLGAAVVVDGDWLLYENSNSNPAADYVAYVIQDGAGEVSEGRLNILVVESAGAEHKTLLRIENVNPSTRRIGFVGVPRRQYAIEATDNIATPVWEPLGTVAADEFGVYWFTDSEAADHPVRFYRSIRL